MIPENNKSIFEYIFLIEVSLRELIIEEMTNIEGARWFKRRMPGDVLGSCKKGIKDSKNNHWEQHIDHHHIYYSNLPDLLKIIVKKDNWKDSFKNIFKRVENITTWLQSIEPIRNKVAHNRMTTFEDLNIVKNSFESIERSIGSKRIENLLEIMTNEKDIKGHFIELKYLIDRNHNCIINYDTLQKDTVWNEIKHNWWFDADYLGINDISPLTVFFDICNQYEKLPRGRGLGHTLEQWNKKNYSDEIYTDCLSCLSEITGESNDS